MITRGQFSTHGMLMHVCIVGNPAPHDPTEDRISNYITIRA